MDPNLRQKRAAEYLGVGPRTFREYAIEPDLLPSPRGTKPIKVWPVSRLDEFKRNFNDPRSRKPVLRRKAS